MSIKKSMFQSIPRKIVAAAISGSIYAILLGLFYPNPFGVEMHSIGQYINEFLIATPTYLMYSFPVILIYGSITSIISDALSKVITKNKPSTYEFLFSFLFHMLFGLILLWISLPASILYFLTDRLLKKKYNAFKWKAVYKSLLIPVSLWLVFMGTIALLNLIENWSDYIV